MNFEETQQDGQRSRALLGIALVVVLLVAAGALFFVWRPEAYQGAVAALTSSPKDTSEPLVSAGATPVATGQALAGTPGATASPRAPAPRPSASDNASVEQVVEQQGGIEQRLTAAEQRLPPRPADAGRCRERGARRGAADLFRHPPLDRAWGRARLSRRPAAAALRRCTA